MFPFYGQNASPRQFFSILLTLSLFLACAFSLHLFFCDYSFVIICCSRFLSFCLVHLTLPDTCTWNTHNLTRTVPGSVSCVTCVLLRVLHSDPVSFSTVTVNSPVRNVIQTSVRIFSFSVWPESLLRHKETRRLTFLNLPVVKPHHQVLLQMAM